MQHTYALLLGSHCATGLSDLAECFGFHTFTLVSSLQIVVGTVLTSVNVLLHPATRHCLSAILNHVVADCQVVFNMS